MIGETVSDSDIKKRLCYTRNRRQKHKKSMKNGAFTAVSCFYSDVSKCLRFETGGRRNEQ